MKFPRRRFLHLAGVAAAVVVLSVAVIGHGAWSQDARTIKIVVPYPPGGGGDVLARLLAEQIGRTQGRSIVIENRAGASTVIGTEAASRAPPDGNTVLITSSDLITTAHFRKLSYNPITSFEPICQLASAPPVIVINNESPYRTLADLINAARASPGNLTLGAGIGTIFHVGSEMLKRVAKFEMTNVPYPGAAPAVTALLGGHITSIFYGYPGVMEQLKSGKLRALATTSHNRIGSLPDVPTVAESGYKDFEVDLWFAAFAPARTPKAAVSQLSSWFNTAIQVSDVGAKLVAQGYYPAVTCGADFAALLRKQFDEFGRVIREANIKAE